MFSTTAEAKICFLPDGSCGTSKMTGFNTSESGCQYKTEAEARNGLGACETTYKQNMCYYRRCKNQKEDSTVFTSYEDCKKSLDDKHECTSCGSCYKLTEKNTKPDDTTCTTKADCDKESKAFEENGKTDSNGTPCGICKVNESCPSGYSTAYQSQSDCLTGETFSSSGMANGKVCGKCEKKIKTCNDINPNYYPVSDTAKYNECKRLDEYYNDGDIFVMETTNVTGSDGKCFYCHHRTCAEIAEYIEAGEQWYPACKDSEIATKMPYLPGADGQCYTCQAKTCKDYAKEFGKTYVMEDDDWECEKATGKNADVFDVIPREVAADGQCYECKLLKCNEISYIYGNKDMECKKGYHLEEESDYIAADGQCYYCLKNTIEVVFEYELQGNDEAGHYTQCVWDGSGGYNLSWTNEMYYCNRDRYGEEYEVGDYYNPNKYYQTCKHVSNWDAYLEVSGNGVDGYDAKTWTLPYDMEMVVTYDIPYMNADSCLGGSENGASTIRWASKGAIQTYPEIFAPRTVRMKFHKGTAVGTHIRKEPVDYLDGMTTDHFKMEYYVNGKKISGSSFKIDDVRYNFSGSWN